MHFGFAPFALGPLTCLTDSLAQPACLPVRLTVNSIDSETDQGDLRTRLVSVWEVHLTDPLLPLLLAVSFLGIAVNRHLVSRHSYILQAFGFLCEYRRNRGRCQEVYYNIARACHQMSKYYDVPSLFSLTLDLLF
ncbi:unnamed protein product [Dicrocoelium dendriticum]|nr:unnamed protein product [Dicrocoelium dendriticum]